MRSSENGGGEAGKGEGWGRGTGRRGEAGLSWGGGGQHSPGIGFLERQVNIRRSACAALSLLLLPGREGRRQGAFSDEEGKGKREQVMEVMECCDGRTDGGK